MLWLEIGLTIAGIMALVKQEIKLFGDRTVRGGAAIFLGIVLLLTIPIILAMAFVLAFGIGIYYAASGIAFEDFSPLAEFLLEGACLATYVGGLAILSYSLGEDDDAPKRRKKKVRKLATPPSDVEI